MQQPTSPPNAPRPKRPALPSFATLTAQLKTWHLGLAISFLAILGLSLPWVWPDDASAPYNAVGILMHFPTAPDKWHMTKNTPIGSAISIMAPATIIVTTLSTSIVILVRQRVNNEAIATTLMSIVMTAVLLIGCSEILDPDRTHIGPFATPMAGLAVIIMCNLALIGIYTYAHLPPSFRSMPRNATLPRREPVQQPDRAPEPAPQPQHTPVNEPEPVPAFSNKEPDTSRHVPYTPSPKPTDTQDPVPTTTESPETPTPQPSKAAESQ